MRKKVLTTIILSIFITIVGVNGLFNTYAFADDITSSQSEIDEEINKNNAEMQNLIDNWDDIEVMPSDELRQKQLEKLKDLEQYIDEYPELQENFIQTLSNGNASVALTGDILITPYGQSFSGGSYTGHAGIIGTNGNNTIESRMEDGVQRRVNDWDTRYPKVIVAGVKGAKAKDCIAAMRDANSRVGAEYNWNYANKWATDKFYCSQLVWRAWINQGFDLDKDGGSIILPTDLLSDKVEIKYKNY